MNLNVDEDEEDVDVDVDVNVNLNVRENLNDLEGELSKENHLSSKQTLKKMEKENNLLNLNLEEEEEKEEEEDFVDSTKNEE